MFMLCGQKDFDDTQLHRVWGYMILRRRKNFFYSFLCANVFTKNVNHHRLSSKRLYHQKEKRKEFETK